MPGTGSGPPVTGSVPGTLTRRNMDLSRSPSRGGRPRPFFGWQLSQALLLKMGPRPLKTGAGAVTKLSPKAASPSKCFWRRSPVRFGAGISNAWLLASKRVVSPPDRAAR